MGCSKLVKVKAHTRRRPHCKKSKKKRSPPKKKKKGKYADWLKKKPGKKKPTKKKTTRTVRTTTKKKKTWGRDKKKFVRHIRDLGVLNHLTAGHVYDRFTLQHRDVWAHDWDTLYGLSGREKDAKIKKWLGARGYTNGALEEHYMREQEAFMRKKRRKRR
jgi:hypothetical protein